MKDKTIIKPEKVQIVNELAAELKEAKSAVFINFSGMDVKLQQSLKKKLKESNSVMFVAKNTLLNLAVKAANLPQELTEDAVLTGQTAVVINREDAVTPVQLLGKFSQEFEKPELKAGVVEGKFTNKDGLIRISKLPSREVLYAQVVGGVAAPMYGLVGTLQGNIQKLLWILKSKSESKQREVI